MQDIQDKLVAHLREKYDPVAIILHGSRANGMARERSDWDFVILTREDKKPLTREIIFGANIELKQVIVPLPDGRMRAFMLRKENVIVLHDPESEAEKLLATNEKCLEEGNFFDHEDRTKRYAFMSSALDGIRDYADTPLIMFDKKIDFHTRVVQSWFRFKKEEFEPSHYYAYPIIQKEDPEFHALIEEFVAANDSASLILTGGKIIKRLFPDLG